MIFEIQFIQFKPGGHYGHDHMVVGFKTTCVISAYHHYVVSFNPIHGEVYSIQQYVIKFVSDLRQVGHVFSGYSGFLPNKTDRHYITEIFLKVAFNNFNPNPYQSNCLIHFFKLKIEIILIVQFYNKPQEVVQTKTFLHE